MNYKTKIAEVEHKHFIKCTEYQVRFLNKILDLLQEYNTDSTFQALEDISKEINYLSKQNCKYEELTEIQQQVFETFATDILDVLPSFFPK